MFRRTDSSMEVSLLYYRQRSRTTDTELPDVEESEEVKQRLRDLGYTE